MSTKVKNKLTLWFFPFILSFMAVRMQHCKKIFERRSRSGLPESFEVMSQDDAYERKVGKKVLIDGNKRNSDIIGKLG